MKNSALYSLIYEGPETFAEMTLEVTKQIVKWNTDVL